MALVELLISIFILVILFSMAVSFIHLFQQDASLVYSVEGVFNALKLAQSKSQASAVASRWGVYFSTSTSDHKYIIFKGLSYAARDSAYDEEHRLMSGVVFSEINLGGNQEVVFHPLTGLLEHSGSLTLSVTKNNPQQRTLYLSGYLTTLEAQGIPPDIGLIKDSRHVHLDYSRAIDTANESVVLTFEGGTIRTIKIGDFLAGGQFSWEGIVDVAGQKQTLLIHTHRLNNPDTQFCLHRERSQNGKGLAIDIDGDANYPAFSPTLIYYDGQGTTTQGSSAFVSAPVWQ